MRRTQLSTEDRFWSKVKKAGPDECWLWQAAIWWNGYGAFRLAGAQIGAHRMVYILVVGPIPEGLHVLHSCDTPRCVNPAHLRLGNPRDNAHERDGKNRRIAPRGEAHGGAKLTAGEVQTIRGTYAEEGVTQQELGRRFGVTSQMIGSIVHGKSWRSLPAEMRA